MNQDTPQRWYLYVVKCSDGTLYTGVTTDLERRIKEHNASPRGAKYTRTRRPVELVYSYSYLSRSQAQRAEHKFKRLSKRQKLDVIHDVNREMKVGDLVKITRYGSRFAPDGTMGLIIEKLPIPEPKARYHQAYTVRCQNGHIARHANFCLELVK